MAMLRAFCDESGKHEQAEAFVVSGYVGRENKWKTLERRWKRALHKEGLREFHMTDCEGGHGEFAGMLRAERDALQRRFIEIILDADIYGVSGGIDMASYNELSHRLKNIRKHVKYTKSPYFLGFEHFVMEVAYRVTWHSDIERIAFVFDRQKEFQGRAKELYDEVVQLKDAVTYNHRLGPLAFDSKTVQVPLQAADVIAYEMYRYRTNHLLHEEPIRWQFELLV
jgi:hypothetical protein